MNMAQPWQEDWRDDVPFADEARAAVMDDTPPAARARMEFESTGMIVDDSLPGGLYDPEEYRAWCESHQPKEQS